MHKLNIDKPYTGTIMTISGNVGNGKNTLAIGLIRVMSKTCFHGTALTKICEYCIKYRIPENERLIKVYSNFPIDLSKDEKLKNIQCVFLPTIFDYIALKKERRHSVFICDEPDSWGFDSHGSATNKIADKAGYRMKHTRKHNRDIIFLTQLWSMVNLRGKRLSRNTLFAVTPENKEFQYGWYKYDTIIPLSIRMSVAKKDIFPYYDSGYEQMEEENNDENENEELLVN